MYEIVSLLFLGFRRESKTLPKNCGKEIPNDAASYSTRKNLLSTYLF